jgi:taurine dioxygenase
MEIIPLPVGFGAEVLGFDPGGEWPEPQRKALREAYDNHHLLVFREVGTLAPETQVRIVALFGPVGANRNAAGEPWTVLRNSEPSGSLPLPFHSDISFVRHPLDGLSLHALALPGIPTSTTFISNANAWDRLSPELQAELHDLTANHVYDDAETMTFDWPVLSYPHPVRMEHARTKRPHLFVSEHHVIRINGMSEKRSAEVLPQLFAALYAEEAQYDHVWREGELLVWNNLALQHARTKPSAPSEGERVLQRVAIGEHNFPDQLEEVRRAQAAA